MPCVRDIRNPQEGLAAHAGIVYFSRGQGRFYVLEPVPGLENLWYEWNSSGRRFSSETSGDMYIGMLRDYQASRWFPHWDGLREYLESIGIEWNRVPRGRRAL